MPVASATFPILRLAPEQAVLPFEYPEEQPISTQILVDIAPDREDYLRRHSTAQIRASLKLGPSSREHKSRWLYRSISTTPRSESINLDRTPEENGFRRVSSPTRLMYFDQSVLPDKASVRQLDLAGPWLDSQFALSLDDSRFLRLDDPQPLVSPRPLGPTHILVAYEYAPAQGRQPNICETPINDLLFALNVPNLLPRELEDGTQLPPLPVRVHGELTRVIIGVPAVESFPALVVYLHNKNQAELFRNLVPQWLRDTMHPMHSIPSDKHKEDPAGHRPGDESPSFWSCFGGLRLVPSRKQWRSTTAVGHEVTVAAQNLQEEETVVATMVKLNGLRDNLQRLGYLDHGLWSELDLMREILSKAVVTLARLAGKTV
ncbi:hypothetical protein BKA70DRAFT_1110906 [Coprinopsis sp. MPI-PUGE-AT-0042]|nr:hypothetical protein BKA70DRAFT_1110906 [Coprinopsis sp. MPI-PUGE-AT-0042]